MFCSNSDFQPDFFNNVAGVAVVLMFAKVVVRRTKRTEIRARHDIAHGVAIAAALTAVTASLWATEICALGGWFHLAAWLGVGIAGIALWFDIWRDDIRKSGP